MAHFVFSSAQCSCTICPMVKGILQVSNHINVCEIPGFGGSMVSTDLMPKMTGVCNSPMNPKAAAGMPSLCQPVWVGGKWINTSLHSVSFETAQGNKEPLLSGAVLICSYGGVIKIDSPANQTVDNLGGVNSLSFTAVKKTVSAAKLSEKQELKISPEAELSVLNAVSLLAVELKEQAETEARLTAVQTESAEPVPKSPFLYHPQKDSLCSGHCPEGLGDSCPFRQARPTDMVKLDAENSSARLEHNMKSASEAEVTETCRNISACNDFVSRKYGKNEDGTNRITCSPAYHHLIPGNQCLNKNLALVTLANFYGYDVNNAENAVCLPTARGQKNVSEEEWTEARFDIMNQTGLPLHSGGHSYGKDFCLDENKQDMRRSSVLAAYLHRGSENKMMYNYENLVDEQLQALQKAMQRKLRRSCRLEGGEVQKQEEAQMFISSMNVLSQQIKKGILSFPHTVSLSKNYYVSYIAMAYDQSRHRTPEEVGRIITKRGN